MTARALTSRTGPLIVDGTPGTVSVGRDQQNRPVMVDLRLGPHGSTAAGLSDALGSALSLALAAGAPADQLTTHPAGRLPQAPASRSGLLTTLSVMLTGHAS